MNDIKQVYEALPSTYLQLTKEYIDITEANVEGRMLKHTSIYAFFGAVLAYAKRKQDRLVHALEMMEAKHKELRRGEFLSSGEKATEASLNGYIHTVPEINELRETFFEAQHKYNLAKNIMSSLEHQKDMLVQMSANRRAETRMVADLN